MDGAARMEGNAMRNTLRKMLVLVLALTLIAGVALPATLAEGKIASNGTTFSGNTMTTYTGMKTALTVLDAEGNDRGAANFNWKCNKKGKDVVSISAGGVLTAKKPGSATITATLKGNAADKRSIKVTVKKNKIDKIYSKPSASSVSYKNVKLVPKSVEIAAPKKVVVEYYLVQNFPSKWKTTKVNYVDNEVYVWDSATMSYRTIVNGKVKNVSVSAKGKTVKTVKITFTGGKVKDTNLCLTDYRGNIYFYGPYSLKYKRPR